jgi:hypothetical protein
MELLPTIEGEPPAPRPMRLLDRWRVTWHGRRDGRRLSLVPEVPAPYLATLRADAEAGQRAVSGWLHDTLVPVDREAVSILTLLDQHRRNPPVAPAKAVPVPAKAPDPRPTFQIPDWVVEARKIAEAQREYDRRIKERNIAEQRLGQLGSTRHHLIGAARAAAHAHIARFDQLVGLYGAALLRRRRNQSLAELGYHSPTVNPEPWVHGDMPLLALEVDSELPDSYRWFLKDFETRTSALDYAIPADIPQAN